MDPLFATAAILVFGGLLVNCRNSVKSKQLFLLSTVMMCVGFSLAIVGLLIQIWR
jgi:hypothetical protein